MMNNAKSNDGSELNTPHNDGFDPRNARCRLCGKSPVKDANISLVFISTKTPENFLYCRSCLMDVYQQITQNNKNTEMDINITKMRQYLDEKVIGQDYAKDNLISLIYMHFCRMRQQEGEEKFKKPCALLIGPTGCGKTLMVSAIAEYLDVPMVQEDATTLTATGYVGSDSTDIIKNLIAKANNDIEKAQNGIVFIDELDKIKRKESNDGRDINGAGAQYGLLKMIEGKTITITESGAGIGQKNEISFDTSNVLFIFAGAFQGLDKIINRRIHGSSVGFSKMDTQDNKKVSNAMSHVNVPDLEKYGLIRELVGRITDTIIMKSLDYESLKSIVLREIKALQDCLDNIISIKLDENAMKILIHVIKKLDTGARGVRSTVSKLLQHHMYKITNMHNKFYQSQKEEIQVCNIVITVDDIRNKFPSLNDQ